jgi:single-stranded DNA-binding protein
VEGRLNHRKYVSKDGQNRETTEIVVKDVLFVGTKREKKMIEANEEVPF